MEYDCRECFNETSAEWAAKVARHEARDDSRAALSALRARYPQGPLAAHVAGLLAVESAWRNLVARLDRDGGHAQGTDASVDVTLARVDRHVTGLLARDGASTVLREAERSAERIATPTRRWQLARRMEDAARALWRAALDPPDAGRTAESGGGDVGDVGAEADADTNGGE